MSDDTVNPIEPESAPAEPAPTTDALPATETTAPAESAPAAEATTDAVVAETPPAAPAEPETPAAAPAEEAAPARPRARAAKAEPEPAPAPAPAPVDVLDFGTTRKEKPRGRRKVRIGRVVSNKMEKTVVVAVESLVRHPLYGKTMRRTTKFKAHD